MMAAILNSAMLYSAILIFPVKLTHTCLDWSHHWHKKQSHSHSSSPLNLHKKLTQIHSFWLNLMKAAILNSFICGFMPSWIQVFSYQNSDSHLIRLVTQLDDGSHVEHFTHSSLPSHSCTKKTSLIHSDSTWLLAAILNSAMLDSATAILDSDTLLSSLRFTQKHSPSTLTLTETNSIWLKLIYSHLTWWWQPSWILPSWILPSWIQPS